MFSRIWSSETSTYMLWLFTFLFYVDGPKREAESLTDYVAAIHVFSSDCFAQRTCNLSYYSFIQLNCNVPFSI